MPLDTVDENSSALAKNPTDPILYKSMSTNWQDRALCRFFSDYTVDTDDLKVSPGLSRETDHSGVAKHRFEEVEL